MEVISIYVKLGSKVILVIGIGDIIWIGHNRNISY